MPPFLIAWRNMWTRPIQTILTTLIVAAGVGLAIAVVSLAAGLRHGLTVAGGPFEIVVGPKGSATQLVMSSVLLQDTPIGNMTYADYQKLSNDTRVRDAVPLGMGDNVHGLRIIGTTPAFFQIAVTQDRGPFYQLTGGRLFSADFEAILGSSAAQQLQLNIGQQFVSSHGTLESANEDEHASFPYTVVGVMAPTGTPADLGIYVPLSSYWHIHEGSHGAAPEQHGANEAPDADAGVTAVLVRGASISATYQIYQEINAGRDLQAALPGMVLTQFLDLLGQGQRTLGFVTYVALIMAAASIALALYSAVLARQRDTAVLRALGARRAIVLRVALWEALLLSCIGVGIGALIGHATALLIGALIATRSALAVPPSIDSGEALILLAMILLGLVAGLLPALRAYHTPAAKVLASGA